MFIVVNFNVILQMHFMSQTPQVGWPMANTEVIQKGA